MKIDPQVNPNYAAPVRLLRAGLYSISVAAVAALISMGVVLLVMYAHPGPQTGEEGGILLTWIVLVLPAQLFLSLCSFFVYRDEYRFEPRLVRRLRVFFLNGLAIAAIGGLPFLLLLL